MNMKVDSSLIKSERLKRAWSQEQLAQVSGLGLRTVHRIEKSGQCSLESLKALASVFELGPEDLREPPEQAPSAIPDSAVRQTLTNVVSGVRKYVTGGIAGAVLASFSFLLADVVVAAQVHLDILGSVDEEQFISTMQSEDKGEAVIQLDDLVRIVLVPTVAEDEQVMLRAEIYAWENDEFILVAEPAVLTTSRKQAKVQLGLPAGQLVELAITPEIR